LMPSSLGTWMHIISGCPFFCSPGLDLNDVGVAQVGNGTQPYLESTIIDLPRDQFDRHWLVSKRYGSSGLPQHHQVPFSNGGY
jgi:hypothetical protein